MRRKISKESLAVDMARAIKRRKTNLWKSGEHRTTFNASQVINNPIAGLFMPEILDEAIRQSGCKVKYGRSGGDFVVTVYGKPCHDFVMLQRLLQKYAKYDLEWNEVTSGDEYLCFNEETCRSVTEFIKGNRTTTDRLTCQTDKTNVKIEVLNKLGTTKASAVFNMK